MSLFHIIVILTGVIVLTISTIFSYKKFFLRKDEQPFHIRYFFIIPFLAALISYMQLYSISQRVFFQVRFSTLQYEQIYIVLNYMVWTLFFITYFYSNKFKKSLVLCILIGSLGVLIGFVKFDILSFHVTVHGVFCTIFCIFSLMYFYNLFYKDPLLELKSEPMFWICMGLLFSSAVTIPIYIASKFMIENDMEDEIRILFPFTNILIILMHCMFIKAALCSTHIRRPSLSSL